MRKGIATIILVGVMIPTVVFGQDIKLVFNNQEVKTGVAPFKKEGTTIVPLKVIADGLGAKVEFDSKNQKVIVAKDNKLIVLPINQKIATVNGKKYDLPVAAQIINGTTMVPVKFVAEHLDCTTGWDYKNNTVKITSNKEVKQTEVAKIDDKNIYTSEYLQELVENTSCSQEVLNFRAQANPRRNGLLKQEGKYFDIYYPNEDYAKEVVEFLTPHMDKSYMMLTDLYGIQAKVEVHLIDGEIGYASMNEEGNIRDNENGTFIWLEEWNDKGGNNISELVHELNHSFFDQANGKRHYSLWLNEANAKLIPSLYMKYNYDGNVDMWSFYDNISANGISLQDANKYLMKGDAWLQKSNGSIERKSQRYGLSLWSYVYNTAEDLDTFKYYLRNMAIGNNDTLLTLEKLLKKDIEEIEKDFLGYSLNRVRN